MMMTKLLQIACFISPHGFGHAARMCALIDSISTMIPSVSFHIFTTTPEWFFVESLISPFEYHLLECDVGLVQTSPIEIDHPRSIEKLNSFYPLPPERILQTSAMLKQIHASFCLCDISPLGIQAASQAAIPTLLLENFTWDWIYSQLSLIHPEYLPISMALQDLFQPDCHIQLQPECPTVHVVDASIGPIARNLTRDKIAMRKFLRIPPEKPMILITLGGVENFGSMQLEKLDGSFHIVAYSNDKRAAFEENITILPRQSGIRSQDLLAASDLVIGKPGYSTVAEVVTAGCPFLCIPRPDFPESRYLEEYLLKHTVVKYLSYPDFIAGLWTELVPDLLSSKNQNLVINQSENLAKIVLEKIFTA